MDLSSVDQLVDVAVKAVVALAPVVVVVWPVVLKALPGIMEAVVAASPDKRMASATSIVTNAALIASGHAVAGMYAALRTAQDPKSPGGVTITPDEWKSIAAGGAALGWKAIQDQGSVAHKRVVDVYGSEEAARTAIMAKVTGDMLKARERAEGATS